MCNTSQGFYGASTSLSPAAQAVMDAVWREIDYAPKLHVRWAAIAALRAAADQLTPYSVEDMPGAAFCRNKILAIAAELEGQ